MPDVATMKTSPKPIILMVAILAATAPFAAALPNTGRRITGTIENVDAQAKEVTLRPASKGSAISFVWNKRTIFSTSTRPADASILKKGRRVDTIYHTPFFGKPYVSRVMLPTTAAPENPTK